MKHSGIINAFSLKMIMLILMLLDHLYIYLFPGELVLAHCFARVVAPVFTFFMTQGMVFTRDRIRYIARLLSFGALMQLVNIIISSITGIQIPNNIFLSLGFSALLILGVDKLRERYISESGGSVLPWIAVSLAAAYASLFCEGGHIVPLMAVIFYFFRNRRPWMYAVYILSAGLPYVAGYMLTGSLRMQFYMIFAVIPIMLYNGERGPDTPFAKYFFYFFYPLHVWVIVLVKAFI